MESKPFWQSKTLWTNMAVAAAAVFIEAAPPELFWVGLVNVVLRYMTTQGVRVT